MSNTMHNNFFDWKWVAILKDGSNIQKFHEGREQLFRLVLDAEKEGKLKKLMLVNGRSTLIVNLTTGIFYVGGMPQNPLPEYSNQDRFYQCIYFMTRYADHVIGGNKKSTEVITGSYNLGWKINVNGRVQKVIYNINALTHVVTVIINGKQRNVKIENAG